MNNTNDEAAHTAQLQHVARKLFLDIAPERRQELDAYWTRFGPQFQIMDDNHEDGPCIFDAGAYRVVRFNHRMMRLFWLGSFALWEGFSAYHHYAVTGQQDITRFAELVECFEATRIAPDVDQVAWPAYLPPPGVVPDHGQGDPSRVGAELAILAVGWALLHELRHLMHQQDGTSAALDDFAGRRAEELSCDAFATQFMLEQSASFAAAAGQDAAMVATKRQLAICCALFTMTLLARDQWGESDSHPAMQARIDHALDLMDAQQVSKGAAVVALAAFETLKLGYPTAPDPERAISTVALRENWTPADFERYWASSSG
jgi:hypothetical protein